MAAGDEYYRCPFEGEDLRNFLYRPSTQARDFEMSVWDQKETGHEIADGLEAWTRPAVNKSNGFAYLFFGAHLLA